MRTIGVTVKPDHLERIANTRTPFPAIEELIWNALDADANNVHVRLVANQLTGLEKVIVEDDGHGIAFAKAEELFSSLGGSWKRTAARSVGGRMLHGKRGEGRFLAFGVGELVSWCTRFMENGRTQQFTISGTRSQLGKFELSDPLLVTLSPGTEVTIENLAVGETALQADDAPTRLAESLAIYLNQYRNVRVFYDGRAIDPADYIKRRHQETISVTVQGRDISVEATLTVIEWNAHQVKSLTLCDATGFPLKVMPAGIQAPGFFFTGYLRSDYLGELRDQGMLDLDELHAGYGALLAKTKAVLREHFRKRSAEQAASLVAQWKAEDVYPYQAEPKSPIEAAERQMFDVLALNLHAYLPDFGGAGDKSKRLSLRLMKQALEQNPAALQRILGEVLDLPAEKQTEFAELLERTSLASMINASKLIADRLDFLTFLEAILFEKENKKALLERSQLHRILAQNTWIFGEQFFLSADDQALTEVLRQHMKLLGREEPKGPVLVPDGTTGIVDLMLSRKIPRNVEIEREHLVVELKRPSVKLDHEVHGQILKYAAAVVDDQRFRGTDTRWTFWAVSNEIDRTLRSTIEGQSDREDGLVMSRETPLVRVWMRSWGQLIEASRARLATVQKALDYNVTRDDAVERLRTLYEKYLPSTVTGLDDEKPTASDKKSTAKSSESKKTSPSKIYPSPSDAAKGTVSKAADSPKATATPDAGNAPAMKKPARKK